MNDLLMGNDANTDYHAWPRGSASRSR